MANPEHVAILWQGVDAWNKWREENPEIKPDLSDQPINSLTCRTTKLFDERTQKVLLRGVNFDNTNLSFSKLDGVNLQDASLRGSDLSGANLQDARLYQASFKGANLQEAKLTNVKAPHTDFSGAIIESTDFQYAVLGGTIFQDVNGVAPLFCNANLLNSKFTGASILGASFNDTLLSGADFSGADIGQTSFDNARVSKVAFDKKTKCRGIDVATCFGSQMFKSFAQDQDFLEEYQEKHKTTYKLWWLFADCGRSFGRWAAWSLGFAILFALIFSSCPSWFPDWWRELCVEYGPRFEQTPTAYAGQPLGFWSAAYFSIVTFTTLGFGDVVAANPMARFLVGVEVVLGYIMLGGLISILANKLARRA